MGRIVFKCLMPEQAPAFGINPDRIVERLTRENWKTRAVCRTDGEVVYYTYVVSGTHDDGKSRRRKRAYAVYITAYPNKLHEYEDIFRSLDQALARANGEDGSDFALNTRPADRSQYPGRRAAPIYISFINGIGRKISSPGAEGGGSSTGC
jgi:hypothetical protein